MASDPISGQVRPYADEDFVGPEDRPKASWELPMYNWRVMANSTIKEYLDQMDGTTISAVQCAVKADQGMIYVRACAPDAPKAHQVSQNPTHRSAHFSLFTPLIPFDFPRVRKSYKAVFSCWPETYGTEKVLAIQIKGYRIERVDTETRQVVAAAEQQVKEIAAAQAAAQS